MEMPRAIGTAGGKGCRFGCLYCFTRDPDYERARRLDGLRTRDLLDATESATVVQPLCDTEFLLLTDWQNYLDELISTDRIISFATKAALSDDDVRYLKGLNDVLMNNGRFLHVGVTIVSLRNWKEIEPHAPSPEQRIGTLRKLWEVGIPTNVLVRPMVPFAARDELQEIVDRTYRFCHGYVSGPLYLTPSMKAYLQEKGHPFEGEPRKASWLKGEPLREAIESPQLESALREHATARGRELFPGNVEAVEHIGQLVGRAFDDRNWWSTSTRREPVATVYVVNPETKEFLLLYHRKLGAWLAPGGHVEFGESAIEAARREVREELGIEVEFLRIQGRIARDGKDFRCLNGTDGDAFCTVEELIRPIGVQDPHIHVDSVFVARMVAGQEPGKRNRDEVTARDWHSLSRIRGLRTFDNVPLICEAVLNALTQ